MKYVLRTVAVALIAVAVLFGAVRSIGWAKKGGVGSRLMASALMLGLGMGIVVNPPQQGVEQAEENRDETGGESGEPPSV